MVVSGYCFANSHHSRAWEIVRSGAKERGRRGDSIPYLNDCRGASWWPDFAGEEGDGGLLHPVLGGGACVLCKEAWVMQEEGWRSCRGERRGCMGRAGR
jgi:hypothetical protein